MLKFQPHRAAFDLAFLVAVACHHAAPVSSAQRSYELRDGQWLGADGFRADTRYVVDGRLTQRRPRRVDSVIDLARRWVVPPFGEAHNHNLEYSTPNRTDSLIRRYLRDGVFYVKNPGNLPRARDSLASRINVRRGVDPALVPEVVRRAHAAGLRVTAHVETAADFHAALAGGVDEINHIPGFRGDEHVQFTERHRYEVTEADAKLAAARGVWVVTTLGGIADVATNGPDSARRRQADALFTRNLRMLRDAGVHLAVGSDAYRDDSVGEATYLATLAVLTPLELLRMWSEATPRAIFPTRRVGCLTDGCEASLLVLAADPGADFSATRRIALRMKDGRLLP